MTDEAISNQEQPGAEPAAVPIAKVIYSGEHEKLVPLEWPIEFDGKVYDQIRVHRVSGKQVRDFLEALRTSEADILPPMIDCPMEVWNALDADDQETVDLAAMEFTPKRLKAIFNAAAALETAGTPAT
jgi:hypothetical protein